MLPTFEQGGVTPTLSSVFENTGAYSPAFTAIALPIAVIAIAAWFVRIPKPEEAA